MEYNDLAWMEVQVHVKKTYKLTHLNEVGGHACKTLSVMIASISYLVLMA